MPSKAFKTTLAACVLLNWTGLPFLEAEPGAASVNPTSAVPSAPPLNYQLCPGDTVAITVFREPDLASQQRLSKDGTVNLPLLKVVKLSGKTTNEAADYVASLLDKRFVLHPQVSVSIVDYSKVKFTILGQVASPGSFDIPAEQSIDILGAIARAGGFTRIANPSNVVVRRTTAGQQESYKVDVKRLMNDKNSSRFLIQANDTISVGERFF